MISRDHPPLSFPADAVADAGHSRAGCAILVAACVHSPQSSLHTLVDRRADMARLLARSVWAGARAKHAARASWLGATGLQPVFRGRRRLQPVGVPHATAWGKNNSPCHEFCQIETCPSKEFVRIRSMRGQNRTGWLHRCEKMGNRQD